MARKFFLKKIWYHNNVTNTNVHELSVLKILNDVNEGDFQTIMEKLDIQNVVDIL